MEGCLPDYSSEGLCLDLNGDLTPPQLHARVKLWYDAARAACQTVSRYNGKWPVPEDVREGCATLITYGCEAPKLNTVLDLTGPSLGVPLVNLDSLDPYLPAGIKRWSSMG
jgi:N-glycosylase/DNA lyase